MKKNRYEIQYFLEEPGDKRYYEQRVILKAYTKNEARKKFNIWLHTKRRVVQYSVHYITEFPFQENIFSSLFKKSFLERLFGFIKKLFQKEE